MFMTQLKAIQITVSLQAPLLLIFQMTGAAHFAALARATSLQKRKDNKKGLGLGSGLF